MPRLQIVIENPILNMPFVEPASHFRFDDEGITDDVVEGRRPSSYFMLIPKAKKKGGQLVFDEWTGDRIEENSGVPVDGHGELLQACRVRLAGDRHGNRRADHCYLPDDWCPNHERRRQLDGGRR
jgi:hypothetical protein